LDELRSAIGQISLPRNSIIENVFSEINLEKKIFLPPFLLYFLLLSQLYPPFVVPALKSQLK